MQLADDVVAALLSSTPMSLLVRLAFVVVLAFSAAGDAFGFGGDVVSSPTAVDASARDCETAIRVSAAQGSLQHPFYVANKGWTHAGDLVVGDQVLAAHGGWLRVGSSTWQQH